MAGNTLRDEKMTPPIHAFDDWPKIRRTIKNADRLIILSDYDGTLSPIADRPDLAKIPEETTEVLERLENYTRCTLGIISGRSIEEVEKLLMLKRAYYAGNHGLEIKGPKLRFTHPLNIRQRAALSQSYERLRSILGSVRGAIVEDKGLTLSVHYRMVEGSDVKVVEKAVSEVVRSYPSLKMFSGKKIFELRPNVDWDKGKCVELIVSAEGRGGLVLYFGDDKTDEDAFKALNYGLTVLVDNSPTSTSAKYFVKDTDELTLLLKKILELLS